VAATVENIKTMTGERLVLSRNKILRLRGEKPGSRPGGSGAGRPRTTATDPKNCCIRQGRRKGRDKIREGSMGCMKWESGLPYEDNSSSELTLHQDRIETTRDDGRYLGGFFLKQVRPN